MKHGWPIFFFFLISSLAHAEALGEKRAWERVSDPLYLKITNRTFESMPTSGQVRNWRRYWSSDFWEKRRGGINYRWNAPRPIGQNLISPTREEALSMNQTELSYLAPSEKLDLLGAHYDYPLKNEIAAYADPEAPKWEGICNGWSEAALHHDEPNPIIVTNPDGIRIPFGSSDIKALLSWYYFRKSAEGYARMGERCWEKEDGCVNDLNAGAFHLALANRVGLSGQSFIADMDRGPEVWNHLVYNYTSEVKYTRLAPRSFSAPGTRRMARIKTVVEYVFILKKNSWTPVLGTENQRLSKRTYEYYLDIDRQGNIIGGEWISKERPDFIWISEKTPGFTGNMEMLSYLVR